MDFIAGIISLLQDPRTFIAGLIDTLGPIGTYGPLFAIVFIETGIVIFPFLPGDSLLFCAGVFANESFSAAGAYGGDVGYSLNIIWLAALMILAAILGNTSNYWIGRKLGDKLIASGKIKALNEKNLAQATKWFDKYGLLAVLVTRFVPIARTIAPFVAGVSRMHFAKFTALNVAGAVLWVMLFTLLGYFFGNLPIVADNFELVIIAILVISVLPIFVGLVKARKK